jgi:membrane fusion protein (multidrug efflux system)
MLKPIHAFRLVTGFSVVTALLGLAGCQKPSIQADPPAPMVGVVESRRMNVPVLVTPNGTTRALEHVTIRARVRGFLTERRFEEGAFVKKGDLLLVIDEEPYKVALDSMRAKQAEAEAAHRKAVESKAREVARAQLELSMAQLELARIQEARNRALLSRHAGSAEELDKSEAERKRWEAQVQADRANLDQAEADYAVGVASTKAQIAAAKAAVRDAELNLGYCRMYAPLDGRIGEAKVKVGNLVGPDASGGGGYSDLAVIHQLDPIGVDIRLSSKDLDRTRELMKTGLAVRLSRPSSSGDLEHPEEGQCYFIDNGIDELTSTFLAKARIPNPNNVLLPGEYVKIRMVVGRLDDIVVVPAPAVMETETGPIVHVVDVQGKVAVRPVEAGLVHEGLRVITKGLDAGVPVIVEGLQSIRPGLVVRTEPSALATRYRPRLESTASTGNGEKGHRVEPGRRVAAAAGDRES